MNITDTIDPKVDQLTADHLIGRTLTIRVTGVNLTSSEQPCEIHYEGENGLPYRPGKSMRRVLVHVWGGDVNKYVGRSMRLYRDDDVQFGGLKVGGVRISHMSDITSPQTLALTAKKGSKKAFKVLPLDAEKPATPQQTAEADPEPMQIVHPASGKVVALKPQFWLENVGKAVAKIQTAEALREWRAAMGQHLGAVAERDETMAIEADRMIQARADELAPPAEAEPTSGFPGDR